MGYLIVAFLLFVCVSLVYYLYNRMMRHAFIKKQKYGKLIAWVLPSLLCVLPVFCLGIKFYNAIIILLHLAAIWALCDLVGVVFKKIIKKSPKHYLSGLFALIITICVFSAGWFLAHHVYQTNYEIITSKNIDNIRIVQITDLHLGTTLNGTEFANELEKIKEADPDILVITGDFVDDDSNKEDLITACDALASFKCKYGIYFVWGNHDEGYFDSRNFTAENLRYSLESAGVIILEDEVVDIQEGFSIIGRKDRSSKDRKSIDELTSNIDKSNYIIILDHQPNDFENESATNADLVLCGHTHGGHIFPAGPIGVLMGANDAYYGYSSINNTNFIISSGISGWGIPFKTGAISEYVVIDIITE